MLSALGSPVTSGQPQHHTESPQDRSTPPAWILPAPATAVGFYAGPWLPSVSVVPATGIFRKYASRTLLV
jgi:hypothetical protein